MGFETESIPVASITHSAATGQVPSDHHGAGTTVDNAIARHDGLLGALQGYTSNTPTIADDGVVTLPAGQVNFPDSQSASADSNTLDDYEEGTWTPTIADDTLDGTGESQAYSIQIGRYTKIGNRVFISFHVKTTDIGSMTGGNSINILGLPFAPLNLSNSHHAIACAEGTGLAITAGNAVIGRIYTTHSRITLYVWSATTGTVAMTINQWSADGGLIGSGVYESAT